MQSVVIRAAASSCGARAGKRWLEGLPRVLLLMQGSYYGLTGIWPLVSIETFQWVTGRKTDHLVTGDEGDHWLVMTVGVLVVAIAVSLISAARLQFPSTETIVLAMSAAVGLMAIDIIYVARQAILPIYLVDAGLECVLISGWAVVLIFGLYGRSING